MWYVVLVIKVYRWHLVQNYFSKSLTFKQNFFVFVETILLSHITPGKVGDIARVWILEKKFDIKKQESTIAYIFDRSQDLFFMMFFVLYSSIFVVKVTVSNYIYALFVVFILAYIFKNVIFSFLERKINFLEKIKTDFIFELKLFFLNTIMFAVHFFGFYMLAKAMNLNLEYTFVIALVSLSTFAALIPISVAGLGVREGVFIYLLATVGVSKEDAVTLSLLDNVVFIALFIIILYLFSKFYFRNELKI